MKKLFKLFLACAILAVAAGLAACFNTGGNEYNHKHGWMWTHDAACHWRECDGCDQIKDYDSHVLEEGVCHICGYVAPIIPPHTHSYGEWHLFAPTESEVGSAIRECETCDLGDDGHVDEVILPVLGDPRYKKTVEGEACVGDGRIIYSITLNGEDFTFSIVNLKGHKLTLVAARPVTCTRDGNIECFVCEVCGKHFRDINGEFEIEGDDWIIPSQGHAFEKFERVYPTCTEGGNEEYFVCGVCNEKFIVVNGKLCAAEDEDIYLPAAGHALQSHPGIEADCESPGVRAYWECMVCRKYFSDGQGNTEIAESDLIIPATGHKFSSWNDRFYYNHYRYSICKHTIREEEPHDYEDGVCKVCDYSEPKIYYDVDAPEGQTGYIIVFEAFSSKKQYADIYMPYLFNQTDPEDALRVNPQKFIEVAHDEQYGTRYLVDSYVEGVSHTIMFFCDFEGGSTFKFHSLARRNQFYQPEEDGSGYVFYLSQSVVQTEFHDVNDLTAASLYKRDGDDQEWEYIEPSYIEFSREESCVFWHCKLQEGDRVERIYRIDITFDEDGKISSASVAHMHTYGDWEITADYHARYPTCEHYSEIEIGDHEYEDGACRVCGFKQPREFAEYRGSGTIYTFEIDGKKIVRFDLSYIKDDGGLPFQNDKAAEDVVKIGEDPTHGELWETMVLRFSGKPGMPLRPEVWFRIQFYWNFKDDTFKLYTVARYVERFADGSNVDKHFGVAIYQSYYKTSFGFEQNALLECSLYVEKERGSGVYEYLTPSNVEYLEEGNGFIWTVTEQVDGHTVETRYKVIVNPSAAGFAGTVTITVE